MFSYLVICASPRAQVPQYPVFSYMAVAHLEHVLKSDFMTEPLEVSIAKVVMMGI